MSAQAQRIAVIAELRKEGQEVGFPNPGAGADPMSEEKLDGLGGATCSFVKEFKFHGTPPQRKRAGLNSGNLEQNKRLFREVPSPPEMLEAFGGERESCAVRFEESRCAGSCFDDTDLRHAYARFLARGLEIDAVPGRN